jgi:hypothetical protein
MTIDIAVLLTALGLVGGAFGWVFRIISGLRMDLADYKVRVAESYVSKQGFREANEQFLREMAQGFKHIHDKMDLLALIPLPRSAAEAKARRYEAGE